ncbi:unnamed protein product [Rotaria sp. Silwood1]|nr:unnamed protein product [Rotaria sp. Silwood1]CAF4836824.1 unnamed protein product [Rotaria sp. Silwood1]
MHMTEAKLFWEQTLRGYNGEKHFPFPYDHPQRLTSPRSGRGATVSFELDTELVQLITSFAHQSKASLYQVFLTTYFAYLFKLAQNESDLCVLSVVANRPLRELHSMVGMLVNMIPCRLQLDPQCSFDELLVTVQNLLINALVHSQFPYQKIVSSMPISVNTEFLYETKEEYGASESISLVDDIHLTRVDSLDGSNTQIAIFDLIITVRHDPDNKSIKVLFNYSQDLFDKCTIKTMTERFHILLRQLFEQNTERQQPIFSLSLLLSNEVQLRHELNSTYLDYSRSLNCLPEDFARHVDMQPQKVAIVLDEQSVTYGELLHSVNQLAFRLSTEFNVQLGDIVCQCVERSIEMIVGQLGILACGATYVALSPNDPPSHLAILIQQTGSRLILVQPTTRDKFESIITTLHVTYDIQTDELPPPVGVKLDNLA